MPRTMNSDNKSAQLTIRITERMMTRLRRAALTEGISPGEYARISILTKIEKTERSGKAAGVAEEVR